VLRSLDDRRNLERLTQRLEAIVEHELAALVEQLARALAKGDLPMA
jgi:hypothetical protein